MILYHEFMKFDILIDINLGQNKYLHCEAVRKFIYHPGRENSVQFHTHNVSKMYQ